MENKSKKNKILLIGASDPHIGMYTGNLNGSSIAGELARKIYNEQKDQYDKVLFFCGGDHCGLTGDDNKDYDGRWCQDRFTASPLQTIPAVGNHDRQVGDDQSDPKGYEIPNELISKFDIGSGIFPLENGHRRTYFRIDVSEKWSFISLDSSFYDTMKYAGNRSDLRPYYMENFRRYYREQEDWLAQEISDIKAQDRYLISMWHHPLFCPYHGDFDGQRARDAYLIRLWQIMYSKVSILMTGHIHNYCRFKPLDIDGHLTNKINAPIWIQVGTGGGTPHRYRFNNKYEYQDITNSEKLDNRVAVHISTIDKFGASQFGIAAISIEDDIAKKSEFKFYLAKENKAGKATVTKPDDRFYFWGKQ